MKKVFWSHLTPKSRLDKRIANYKGFLNLVKKEILFSSQNLTQKQKWLVTAILSKIQSLSSYLIHELSTGYWIIAQLKALATEAAMRCVVKLSPMSDCKVIFLTSVTVSLFFCNNSTIAGNKSSDKRCSSLIVIPSTIFFLSKRLRVTILFSILI